MWRTSQSNCQQDCQLTTLCVVDWGRKTLHHHCRLDHLSISIFFAPLILTFNMRSAALMWSSFGGGCQSPGNWWGKWHFLERGCTRDLEADGNFLADSMLSNNHFNCCENTRNIRIWNCTSRSLGCIHSFIHSFSSSWIGTRLRRLKRYSTMARKRRCWRGAAAWSTTEAVVQRNEMNENRRIQTKLCIVSCEHKSFKSKTGGSSPCNIVISIVHNQNGIKRLRKRLQSTSSFFGNIDLTAHTTCSHPRQLRALLSCVGVYSIPPIIGLPVSETEITNSAMRHSLPVKLCRCSPPTFGDT